MKGIRGIFSGDASDFSRVGWWGVILLLLGSATVLLAGKLSARARDRARAEAILRIFGLLLAAVGALGAMKII